MTASLDMIRGRSNIVTLTNNSGGALVAGDVCVQDTTGDERATTTTSAASVLKVFVAAESIASAATGKFYESGYCPLVNVNASVTRGRFLFTHTVAKQAAENASYGAGAFGKILKSGTTPSALIYSATAQTSGTLGSWTSYTPTWTGTVSNPVLNDGTLDGYYLISSKTLFITIRLLVGASTTFGSGLYRWALPGGVAVSYPQTLSCLVLDSGTTHRSATGTAGYSSSTTMAGYGYSGNDFSPTVPMTWAVNDMMLMSGTIMID